MTCPTVSQVFVAGLHLLKSSCRLARGQSELLAQRAKEAVRTVQSQAAASVSQMGEARVSFTLCATSVGSCLPWGTTFELVLTLQLKLPLLSVWLKLRDDSRLIFRGCFNPAATSCRFSHLPIT